MCILPVGIRCSPWKKPLSAVNTSTVLLSSPFALSSRTIAWTPSSTERTDSSRQRYLRWMSAISSAFKRGRFRISAGLSETSGSLKFGGLGSGSESNAWAWRGAGFAVLKQLKGGFGFGFGPPPWGAV